MSRARGNGPSKSFTARLKGNFSSTLDYVEECIAINREINALSRDKTLPSRIRYPSYPAYRSLYHEWVKRRPLTRTRFSGLVGPEPDFGARESDIPRVHVWTLVQKSGLPTDFFQSQPHAGNNVPVATHGCIGSFGWTNEQIKAWTALCVEYGIEFNGKRGYKFPRGLGDAQDASFSCKKECGSIPSHRRSDLAKLRRAAKRGKREALISSRPPNRLFTTRYRLSAKQCRESWYRTCVKGPVKMGFTAYRDSVVGKGITLYPRKCYSVVPNIVFRSLRRIYSKPVKVLENRPWFKVDDDLRYILEIPNPPRRNYPRMKPFREGSIVISYNDSLDDMELDHTIHSTIPRVNRRVHPFSELEWSRDHLNDRFVSRIPGDFLFN